MATMVTSPTMSTDTEPPPAGRAPSRSRILVVLIVVLALAGAVLAGWMVRDSLKNNGPGVGDTVGTKFGSLTVTRVSKTFVPDTQGPPTHAQHVGANGKDQLQVWVSLANTRDRTGVAFAPGQFSLISADGRPKTQKADGSTLGRTVLQKGGSIDGQVWFNPPKAGGGQRWLVFAPPGGQTVRISLGDVDLGTAPSGGSSGGHQHH